MHSFKSNCLTTGYILACNGAVKTSVTAGTRVAGVVLVCKPSGSVCIAQLACCRVGVKVSWHTHGLSECRMGMRYVDTRGDTRAVRRGSDPVSVIVPSESWDEDGV
jgi:hypothetical protein